MDKLIESSIHKDFAELYKSGTREELKKYHSIGVEYNLRLHEEIQTIKQQLKEANYLLDRYHDETMREIKFPDFDNVRCNLSKLLCSYQDKYKVKE
jgi:hypothetical protein